MPTPRPAPRPRAPTLRVLAAATAAAAALVPGGCATGGGGWVAPEVAVTGLRVLQVDLLQTSLELDLRLENENLEPALVEGGVHRFYLGGKFVGKALSSDRVELPGLGSATATATLNVSNLKLAQEGIDLVSSGVLRYRLESQLHTRPQGASRRRTTTSRKEGSIDLSNPLQGVGGANPRKPRRALIASRWEPPGGGVLPGATRPAAGFPEHRPRNHTKPHESYAARRPIAAGEVFSCVFVCFVVRPPHTDLSSRPRPQPPPRWGLPTNFPGAGR